jgi:hypothetical protein
MAQIQKAAFNTPERYGVQQNIYLNPSPNPASTVGTIAAWINLQQIPSGENHIISAGGGRNWWGFGFTSSAQLTFRSTNWATGGISTTSTITPGTWYHVAVTQDGTSLRFYINGQLDHTVTTNRWWSTYGEKENLYILAGTGYNSPYASLYGYPLNARGQNIQLWDAKLEDSEINTLYNSGQPLLTTDTQPKASNLHYWFFPSDGNFNLYDSSSTPSTDAIQPRIISYDPRNMPATTTKCLTLTNSVISTGDPQGFTVDTNTVSGSLTVSTWINWASQFYVKPFTFLNSNGDTVEIYWKRSNATMYFSIVVAGSNVASIAANTNIYGNENGIWQNWIIHIPNASTSWDPANILFWRDGKSVSLSFASSTQPAIQQLVGPRCGYKMAISNWAAFENLDVSDYSNIKAIRGTGAPTDLSSLNPKVWYKLTDQDVSFATSGNKATAMSITDSSGNNLNATGPYDYDE